MIKIEKVSETSIKDALIQGYITKKEAYDMLNVYLLKLSFSNQKNKKNIIF